MKTLTTLMILVLIPILSYSQDSYPKRLIIGSDTVVAITQEQSRQMTKAFIENSYLNETNDSLEQKIIYLQSNRVNDSTIIANLNTQIGNLEQIQTNTLLENQRLIEDLEATDKELIKQQRIGKFKSIGIGILIVLSIILSAK